MMKLQPSCFFLRLTWCVWSMPVLGCIAESCSYLVCLFNAMLGCLMRVVILLTIVERAFGILKAWFRLLTAPPKFSAFPVQHPRMKGGSFNGLRGKQLLLTLIVVCTTILIWAWEKTPPNLQLQESLDMLPPVSKFKYANQHPSAEEDFTKNIEKAPVLMPKHSPTAHSLEKRKEDKDIKTAPKQKKECYYGKGKWIADSRRPLYSGFECKQWLSEMWACRLTQRTDFSYENFRWQPEGCEMPEFEGSKVLQRMQDQTIALVGDSLGRQQFQSMMCMVTGGKENLDVEDVGSEYGLIKALGAKRPDGWAYRFPSTNTTILYYWSASLCELEPLNISDPATKYAMHLDRPATFLKRFVHRFDVLVLNTGHHWNRGKLTANRWEMYVRGEPNTDRKTAQIWNAKNLAVYSVVKWLDSQLPHHPRLKVFFRTISPRHFFNGDWNTGGSCDNTNPLAKGSEVIKNGSLDSVVEGAVKGTRVKILDITALSELRDEGHMSRYSITAAEGAQDCLHWCLPGIPDTWNEILFAQV